MLIESKVFRIGKTVPNSLSAEWPKLATMSHKKENSTAFCALSKRAKPRRHIKCTEEEENPSS